VGTVSEIVDAEAPFIPRGCISQAWSVAELLRVIVRTPDVSPGCTFSHASTNGPIKQGHTVVLRNN
jgi:glycogen debranching enzyme